MNPEQKVDNWLNESGYIQVPEDIDSWLHPEDKMRVRHAGEFREALKRDYLNPEEGKGLILPWLVAEDFRLRKGEVTLHSGYRGHKKSMMLGMWQLGLISQGETCLSFSFEMLPIRTLKRMLRQFTGIGDPNLATYDRFFNFLNQKFLLYDQLGTVKWQRVIALSRYAIQELGVNQVFIDSLMKINVKKKDLETQAQVVDELCALAKDTNSHIHLVAHSNKANTRTGKPEDVLPPGIDDVSGSGDLTNMVDNVVIHFQNKSPQFAYAQMMNVDKQRNPEGNDPEPSIKFDFDSASLQFQRDHHCYKPTDWEQARWT